MAATAGDGTLLLKAGSGDAVMTTQRITDDLERLLALLPDPVRDALGPAERREQLLWVVLDLGRVP